MSIRRFPCCFEEHSGLLAWSPNARHPVCSYYIFFLYCMCLSVSTVRTGCVYYSCEQFKLIQSCCYCMCGRTTKTLNTIHMRRFSHFQFCFFILSFSIALTSYFVDRRVLKISKYWFFFSWRARSRMHACARQTTNSGLWHFFFFSVFLSSLFISGAAQLQQRKLENWAERCPYALSAFVCVATLRLHVYCVPCDCVRNLPHRQ